MKVFETASLSSVNQVLFSHDSLPDFLLLSFSAFVALLQISAFIKKSPTAVPAAEVRIHHMFTHPSRPGSIRTGVAQCILRIITSTTISSNLNGEYTPLLINTVIGHLLLVEWLA